MKKYFNTKEYDKGFKKTWFYVVQCMKKNIDFCEIGMVDSTFFITFMSVFIAIFVLIIVLALLS